jgi:sigma-B regulation protein RsbU (phosphoserine phosphatase)
MSNHGREWWKRMSALLDEALDRPPEDRMTFLEQSCTDSTLLDVKALLRELDLAENSGFMAQPVFARPVKFGPPETVGVSEDPHQLVGRTLHRYHVLEQLGRGGMGVVYKARDTRLDRTVALKLLPPHLTVDAAAQTRFILEARAASALDHPNICTIYEMGETDSGRTFIAMACYDGETLQTKIARGPLSIQDTLHFGVQLAEALSRAHRAEIVHRDIKPANVMVTGRGRVKVLDFGIAKMQRATAADAGGVLGTSAYMSPEQIQGNEVDHRTDIWSLGVVLYEMLTGRRPFQERHASSLLQSVLHRDPQPVTGYRGETPLRLAHLIHKSVEKDMQERHQRMSDLARELRAVQKRSAAKQTAEDVFSTNGEQRSASSPSASHSHGHASGNSRPVKILVVDDEPKLELLVRQRFRKKIRANEWTFVYAADGVEALEHLARDREVDLVLTDLNMPNMDGLTLLARLGELERSIKAVVVSAYDDMDNIRTAMNRGAFDFVTKPIDFKDLEITIQKTWTEVQAFRKASSAQRQLVMIQKELEVARRIQEAATPAEAPPVDSVDLHGSTIAARDISGTFYNFVELDPHHLGFYIGDVASKGIAAALFMAMSQTFLAGPTSAGEDPGQRLTFMNRLLFPSELPDIVVTAFYGLLDVRAGKLAYSSAGHPWPLLVRADGEVASLDNTETPPVWHAREQTYGTDYIHLRPGDRLFLYTDGVTGALDAYGKPYSLDHVREVVASCRDSTSAETVRSLVRSVMDHVGDAPLARDVTAMDLRYLG